MRLIQMIQQSLNKAELMCKAQKVTFYEPIGAAIKIGAMAGTNDLAIIQASTKPGYDAACMSVTMHWKKLLGHGKKAVLMVAGGLALAISASTNPALHIIVVVLTAGAALWFIVTKTENERSLVRAKAELLPELDRAFAEGRYVKYG
jgi:hypothetical protein